LAGHFNPPDGSSFRAVLIGEPDDRWVVASSAGYGFVVRLEELHSNKKAGKTALRVKEGFTVVPASPLGGSEIKKGLRLAAASSDGRLLVFPLAELPELSKGKGNKILAVPGKDGVVLAAICVLAPEQALRIDSGTRHMVVKPGDLEHYAGARGRRGMALPRGWRTVDRLGAE
jgi:topoisomerase-4 subunit A